MTHPRRRAGTGSEVPDPAAVRAVLEGAGWSPRDVRPVGEARTSWTYLVDGQWLVRFPRSDAVVQAMAVPL